jgi:molybdenum cofactor cytidylyltransferase
MEPTDKMPVCVAATILAAGSSERMGRPKQLLSIEGQPMVRRVTEVVCASGLAQVIVVVGAHAERVEAALIGLPVEIAHNQSWREGLSTSLHTGIGALRPDIGAVLVILADQPALTPGLLLRLVERYRATGAPIVAPVYRGQRGNPVLFDRSLFPELLAVHGDRGARKVVARYAEQLERVACDDPAVVQDVDTVEDYQTATGAIGRERS